MRTRQRSASVAIRDRSFLARIQSLKADHPAWGYRRIWSYLRYRDGLCIGKNRVYRLLREHRLLATQTRTLRARRGPLRHKPRTTIPNRIWGIDMTKIHVHSWGWLYLHLVLDWGSKKVVGWQLSSSSKTKDWLAPLSDAINIQFPAGRDQQPPLLLVSDNGCQPTSTAFRELGIGVSVQILTELPARVISDDDWNDHASADHAWNRWRQSPAAASDPRINHGHVWKWEDQHLAGMYPPAALQRFSTSDILPLRSSAGATTKPERG